MLKFLARFVRRQPKTDEPDSSLGRTLDSIQSLHEPLPGAEAQRDQIQTLDLSLETAAALTSGAQVPEVPMLAASTVSNSGQEPLDVSGMAWVRGQVIELTDMAKRQLFNSTRMRRNRVTRDLTEAAAYAKAVVAEVVRRRADLDATWNTAPELTDAQQMEFDIVFAQAKLAGLDADACRHRAYFAAYRLGDKTTISNIIKQVAA